MAAIAGKEALIGVNVSTTWSTEVATTHLVPVESFTFGKSVGQLVQEPIGLAKCMADEAQAGAETITPSFRAKLNYEETFGFFLAQFFGTAGTPTEQNNPNGDWLHRLVVNTTLNAKLLTLAIKDSSAETIVYPSAAVSGVTINFANPPNYVDATFNLIGDEEKLDSSTNTTTVLEALSATSANMVIIDQADEFLINAQASGALTTSTDRLEVLSMSIALTRPQSSQPEIKGVAGNASPTSDGLITADVTIILKNKADHTYLTAADVGTEYKMSIKAEGEQIGSGDNEKFEVFIPRAVIVDHPGHDLTTTGFNPMTITFKGLVAAANPTGMNSTYPYVEFTNNYSTDLLA